MFCTMCGSKMGCRFSVASGAKLRYRTYKCEFCEGRLETVELPLDILGRTDLLEDIKKLVDKSKRERFSVLKNMRRKGGGSSV